MGRPRVCEMLKGGYPVRLTLLVWLTIITAKTIHPDGYQDRLMASLGQSRHWEHNNEF